jgi:hypothetical protein
MFANIDFIFLSFKSIRMDINDLKTKLEHLKKWVKKIAILMNSPFKIFRRKKLLHISCIFNQKIQQKSDQKKMISPPFSIFELENIFCIFFHLKVF